MFGESFEDISPDLQRPILCQRCQSVTDVPDVRPFRTVEPRFLRSDYIPSLVEMSELKDVLEQGKRELKRYEEDIAVLRQIHERLENKKSAVEKTTRQCRTAISAQRRVPAEIWEMIFSMICLSLCEYSFKVNYYCSDSPLLGLPATIISQVCSHWRTIAKASSKLWSSINVTLSEPPYNVALPLEIYFSNSGDYPLKLRIGGDGAVTDSSWGVALWESLSRHMHRSRELTMAMNNYADIGDPTPFQRLTFLNLESYHEECLQPDNSVWPRFWPAIQKSTKLAVVSSYLVNRAIPFSQLTTWEIQIIECPDDMDDFLDVAWSCMALKSLTLSNVSHIGTSFPVAVREVNLPSLRGLSVKTYWDDYSWLPSIFGSLVMLSLEICHIHHYAWPLPSALLDMVRRSSTSLKQLRLTLMDDWDAKSSRDPLLLDILQAVPKLTHFELTLGRVSIEEIKPYNPFIDDIISALLSKFEDESPDFFLPQLHYFSLVVPCATLNTELVKRILQVVSARQCSSHPLAEFHFVRRYEGLQFKSERFVMERELLERIRMLEEGRVKVVIQDYDP